MVQEDHASTAIITLVHNAILHEWTTTPTLGRCFAQIASESRPYVLAVATSLRLTAAQCSIYLNTAVVHRVVHQLKVSESLMQCFYMWYCCLFRFDQDGGTEDSLFCAAGLYSSLMLKLNSSQQEPCQSVISQE